MIVLRSPLTTKNFLVTIAIGETYLFSWETYAKHQWLSYCERYDLGLIVIDEDIANNEVETWKKPTWQKLLIGKYLSEKNVDVDSVCYLDSDIFISPYAENVFVGYDKQRIGLVSLGNNIPYDRDRTLKAIAYNRHNYYSTDYPLDSALFLSPDQHYLHHDMEPQEDYACMGFILFNIEQHSSVMVDWFRKYKSDVYSITNGGDQTHLNYEIQRYGLVQWYNYRFQAIWVYEMASKYPFLYRCNDVELIKSCLEASLTENHFLHFAGSWNEKDMFLTSDLFSNNEEVKKYQAYLDKKLSGTVLGTIKPKC